MVKHILKYIHQFESVKEILERSTATIAPFASGGPGRSLSRIMRTPLAHSTSGRGARRTGILLQRALVASALVIVGAVSVAVPLAKAGANPPTFTNPTWANQTTWSTGFLPDDNEPIAESSPIVANLDGSADDVVVGDRRGNVYAFNLASGDEVPGWPTTDGSGPIDSTPSVSTGAGSSTVYIGSGDDADPTVGGYQAFSSTGHLDWFSPVVNPPTDNVPATAVIAGMTVASLQGGQPGVYAGSAGQVSYALNAGNGAPLTGWPYFNSDSTHSTAATADLYGTGQTEIIDGGDQTAGMGRGRSYTNGGHLRILSATGNLICSATTNQVIDSSPAVGGFLAGGATGIFTGTGYEAGFQTGASDTDTVKAYNTRCQKQWSDKLDGSTESSPALGDLLGNGQQQVAEVTAPSSSTDEGSLWILNAANGAVIRQVALANAVVDGSVVTANLELTPGQTDQDIIVPTKGGAFVYDASTGDLVAQLDTDLVGQQTPEPYTLALQNAPLITRDPNGAIGITLAGYLETTPTSGVLVGQVDHFEIPHSDGAAAVGPGSWPMFHHDPQLTGNAGGTTPHGSIPACDVPAAANPGYNLAASDGGVFSFGGTPFCGSTGNLTLQAPVVATAMAPGTGGYWEVASDGGIFAYGQAGFYGSMGGQYLNRPIVGMAATPDGKGYWEVASDGGIFAFGDARFYGSMGGQFLNQPIVGISSSSDGNGYRMVASDGGIFSFGDAPFFGSMGGQPLNKPIVGTVNDTNTGGYWEVAADGGVFAFGGAPFFGSTGSLPLNAPIVGMSETSNGSGYRFVASDGGIFSFNAPFYGSMGGQSLNKPIVGMVGF